jgi:hypothetical protein
VGDPKERLVSAAPFRDRVVHHALFHDDPAVLTGWREKIDRYLEGRRLMLHPRKTAILPTAEPAQFLGFVLCPGGRRLPEDNVARFRNRLRGLRDRWRAGTVTRGEGETRIAAWIAHASHADTFWRPLGAVREYAVRAVAWGRIELLPLHGAGA